MFVFQELSFERCKSGLEFSKLFLFELEFRSEMIYEWVLYWFVLFYPNSKAIDTRMSSIISLDYIYNTETFFTFVAVLTL